MYEGNVSRETKRHFIQGTRTIAKKCVELGGVYVCYTHAFIHIQLHFVAIKIHGKMF